MCNPDDYVVAKTVVADALYLRQKPTSNSPGTLVPDGEQVMTKGEIVKGGSYSASGKTFNSWMAATYQGKCGFMAAVYLA